MAKKRIDIPKKTRECVMSEYSHRCAICGTDNPHLHHIDEDPSNNDQTNLIPLCPNCHLLDQHNPTSAIDKRKLHLFRHYKDPSILSPKFEPVFRRLEFLLALNEDFDLNEAKKNSNELVEFITELEMGKFYSNKIKDLVKPPNHGRVISLDMPDSTFRKWAEDDRVEYIDALKSSTDEILSLVVELLRYQDWNVLRDQSRRKA